MQSFPARRLVQTVAGLLLVAACTDTEYVDRPPYEDPPPEASGYLGYGNATDDGGNVPVCGNCHADKQIDWRTTAHGDAWATLEASGHSQVFCEGCHTVSELGNAATSPVGWTATADVRYHDVQCESCHGPGEAHVASPGTSQPLASIAVGPDLDNGCGECHSGSHHPFVDEWAQSRHGFAGNESIRGRDGCNDCHEGRRALEVFGEYSTYVEQDIPELQPIGCSICHDPHGSPNGAQMRFAIDVPNVEQNLCMKCHHKRAVPEIDNSRGPHSPQGPLVLGEDVGWIPPNFDTGTLVGTHGSEQNQRLCATCHVNSYEITDSETGEFVFNATGHLFQAIPCVDGQGLPTTDDCAIEQRTFASCTASGCHGSEDAARSAYTVASLRVQTLVDDLFAQLAQVPASEFDTEDNVLTVAEGSRFNAQLGDIDSSATHNPFMTEALLLGSMQAVEDEYGVSASLTPSQIGRRLAELRVSTGH
ncbi:MAG: cytochrome c3 family protein [Gemmatimonadota bacterium]|nr:cytochrome c3 family protein [Gemmatimonadota bacterium]